MGKWATYPPQLCKQYWRLTLLRLIWRGTKMETGSGAPSTSTQSKICDFVATRTIPEAIAETFDMEEENVHGGWLKLSVQAVRAWDFPQKCGVITTEKLKMCHLLMFDGAIDHGQLFAGVGKLRTKDVCAGSHQFPAAAVVTKRLANILDKHEETGRGGEVKVDAIERATICFYQVVTLHPFANGNGRLSRMLFAHSLCSDGFPFPVFLTNGHGQARKHYIKALQHAQERGKSIHLKI